MIALLSRDYPELKDTYVMQTEEWKQAFAIEHVASDQGVVMAQLQGIRDEMPVTGYDKEVEALASASMAYRHYHPVARLVYLRTVPAIYLTKPMSISGLIQYGSSVGGVSTDSGQHEWDFDGSSKIQADYDMLTALNPAEDIIRASLSIGATDRDIYFAAGLFHGFLDIQDCKLVEMTLSGGRKVAALQLPSGRTFELVCSPITGAPMYIADAEAFEAELRRFSGNKRIHVIPCDKALLAVYAYIMATCACSYQTGVGLTVKRVPNEQFKGLMTLGDRRKIGELVVSKLPDWSKQCKPSTMLSTKSQLPAYLHMLLNWARKHDPDIVWPSEGAAKVFENATERRLDAVMAVWKVYKNLGDYGKALSDGAQVPVLGIHDAAKKVAERRDVENKSPFYNGVFNGTDVTAGPCWPVSIASGHKYMVATAILKRLVGAKAPPTATVWGVGDATMCPFLHDWSPTMLIDTYDGTKRQGVMERFTPADLSGPYPESDCLIDVSYGDADRINNAKKIIKITTAKRRPSCGYIKLYMGPEERVVVTPRLKLPYDIQELFEIYSDIVVCAPGKAHSPELFVIFANPGRCKPEVAARALSAIFAKGILMDISNKWRSELWASGQIIGMGNKLQLTLPGLYKEFESILAFGVAPRIKTRNLKDVISIVTKEEEDYTALPALAVGDAASLSSLMSDFLSLGTKRDADDEPPPADMVEEDEHDALLQGAGAGQSDTSRARGSKRARAAGGDATRGYRGDGEKL